jgi:hypothetical protein
MRLWLYVTVFAAVILGFIMTAPIWVVFAGVIYGSARNL